MNFKISKKNIIVALSTMVFLITALLLFLTTQEVQYEKEQFVQGKAPTIATSHIQTNTYNVQSAPHDINAGAYLYQEETKSNPKPSDIVWIADTVTGKVKIKNLSDNIPDYATITVPLDMNNYKKPTTFNYVKNGSVARTFTASQLNKMEVRDKLEDGTASIKFLSAPSYDWQYATAVSVGGSKVHATYKIGGHFVHKDKQVFYTFPNGTKKYKLMYETPFQVSWTGVVEESKEIKATPDFTTTVGASTQLKAEVRSKTGTGAWTVFYDKTATTSETSWRSDNPSVVSVDNKGKITAHKQGTATIHVNWKSSDGDYHITTKTVVTVGNSPVIQIMGEPNVCFDKGETSFGAYYYDKNNPVAIEGLAETTWTSSDTSVATVSKGKVTFKKIGKTKITVTYKGISGL